MGVLMVNIRKATVDDVEVILRLINHYADRELLLRKSAFKGTKTYRPFLSQKRRIRSRVVRLWSFCGTTWRKFAPLRSMRLIRKRELAMDLF